MSLGARFGLSWVNDAYMDYCSFVTKSTNFENGGFGGTP